MEDTLSVQRRHETEYLGKTSPGEGEDAHTSSSKYLRGALSTEWQVTR
jgi:hypothetical protein